MTPVGVLQERYGYEKEMAENEVNDFTNGLKPLVFTAATGKQD